MQILKGLRRCALIVAVSLWGVAAEGDEPRTDYRLSKTKAFPHGCVAADHPLASEAGAEMLRRGGNVVDAAVATAFALSVVRPEGCGLGGGGVMVIWDATKKRAVAVDYRERAPQRASRDMFLGPDGTPADGLASRVGGLAVAVPGEVAGLCFILKKYGTLDLPTVLEPAIRLAREGFVIDQTFREAQAAVLRDFAAHGGYSRRFAPLWKLYLNDGEPFAEGHRFHSPLVPVLEQIASHGAAGFHEGPVAEAIVETVRQQGGILTLEDLSETRPVVREPVRGTYGGYDVISMPPPSSGGIAIIETLNILSAYERLHPGTGLEQFGQNNPTAVHRVIEAMKHAFADRAEFLGDTDFADVPVERLLSQQHAARLAAKIDPERTLPFQDYGGFAPVNDGGTSHISIIDAEGNAVACTETINTLYGSYVVEPKYGIVLNNEMDDFAAVPGLPNAFGLIQSEANAVAPGKKPLSSMSPTILTKDGKATIVAGASGGPRIITATLQVLLKIVSFGEPVEQAVQSPRFHHQWLPESLFVEPELLPAVKRPLEQRGHQITVSDELGVVQAAIRTDDGVIGASDPRKGGRPEGH